MPKLAIYVSKKDMKNIERWRKRINFSRVFIHAVFDEVRRLERTADTPDEKLAAAAEFYRGQLSADAAPLADLGFELGTKHVLDCKLSPELIRALSHLRDGPHRDKKDWKQVETCLTGDQEQIEEFAQEHGFADESHPTWREAVQQGYLDGVASAWEKVCEKMRTNST